MSSIDTPQTFDWYAESEWRIIFFDDLLYNYKDKYKYVADPTKKINENGHAYFNTLSQKEQVIIQYLVPLDCWFSMIIYPSLAVKNEAQHSDEIRELITKIKGRGCHCPIDERKNLPIELDLDACRNF